MTERAEAEPKAAIYPMWIKDQTIFEILDNFFSNL